MKGKWFAGIKMARHTAQNLCSCTLWRT